MSNETFTNRYGDDIPLPPTQYEEHKAESDSIVETLKELVIMNKIMHDGLGEAQTMIGERDLTIIFRDKIIEEKDETIGGLHNDLLIAREALKRVNTLAGQINAS